jgi:hypothetical protein
VFPLPLASLTPKTMMYLLLRKQHTVGESVRFWDGETGFGDYGDELAFVVQTGALLGHREDGDGVCWAGEGCCGFVLGFVSV